MIAAIWILLVSVFPPINLLFPFGYAIKYAIFMAIALVLFKFINERKHDSSSGLYFRNVYVFFIWE